MYRSFLKLTDCENIECLRQLNTSVIAEANRYLYQDAAAEENGFQGPSIGYAPVLDNNLAKDVPLRVMQNSDSIPTRSPIKRLITGGMKNEFPGGKLRRYMSRCKTLT